jgi:uncharacterized protein YecE (DUF72 family)
VDVHVGCSGWNYRDWRERFYPRGVPQRSWLEYYAQTFRTVEVNATFYRLPTRATVAAWVDQTPEGFVFAVKASRYMTHVRRLTNVEQGIPLFYERIEPLRTAGKLGPILWQLPPTFRRDDERLAHALSLLKQGRHCFEFRDSSWFADDVYELLREHGAALVISDHPKWPMKARELTADWTYVRLHHGSRGRRGNYSRAELETWRRQIEELRRRAEVYVYFNNDWEAFAVRNALWLQQALE